jgi:transposase
VREERGYYTDTTDGQWALIEPVIGAWKARHPSASGHVGRYAMRRIVDALIYQSRSGCQWSLLPREFPPASAVKYYFYRWRDEHVDEVIHELLRCRVREAAGREEDPSLVVLDSQSVHAAVNVPAATSGKDAAKKVPGRKRGIAVDAIGLIIAVVVMAASAHDNAIGTALLSKAAATSTVSKALVDQGFKNTVVEHGLKLGIDVEIVERNPAEHGLRATADQVAGRADARDLDAPPAAGAGLRVEPEDLRIPRVLGDNHEHAPAPDRNPDPDLARRVERHGQCRRPPRSSR